MHGFVSGAVLCATGGFGRIYERSTNALINTGDGQYLAFKAGAALKDMEFVQFHPTTLFGSNILISEAARGEGGFLVNREGERFMVLYAPSSGDLAPRDVVARAIEREIAAGRGFEGGYVHLDLRRLGEGLIRERLPGIRQIAIEFAGLDPIDHPIPVQPGQHYSMGGLTLISGVRPTSRLVCGRGMCLCQRPRRKPARGKFPARNSGLRKLVGEAMAADLRERRAPDSSSVEEACEVEEKRVRGIIQKDGGTSIFAVLDELKTVMSGKFGLFREREQMESGLSEILALKEKASDASFGDKGKIFNQALLRFLELEGMLHLAEVVARGALGREESRGSHARTDFPARDDVRFLTHTIARLHEGKVCLEYQPVQPGMFPLQERGY